MKQKIPKNILIIKPSALGDVALALPSLSSLRASFPDARITWFVRQEFAVLLDNCSSIDDIIIFDRKFLGKWWFNPVALAALVRLTACLRRGKFDLVIDLQGLLRTALFAWLTGCKKRFGMATAREFATVFYTDKIAQDHDSIHVIDYYNKIMAAAGASVISTDYNLAPSDEAIDSVAGLLAEHQLDGKECVVFVPGSARTYKNWPVKYYASLAEKITRQFDLPIIAVGSKSERLIVRQLQQRANVPIMDIAGLTDIPQLIALLKGAKLVISNDTGPGHVAVALGTAVVIIFGQTNPARISPYQKPNSFVAIDINGRGDAIESSEAKHRIKAVTVEQVFEKASFHLK